MLFFGHIAVSVACADAFDVDTSAAIAGNLLPDVTDKTGGWVLRVMPSGRWLAHGLPFFALTCLVSRPFLPDRRWRGFAMGYASHLIADYWAGGRLPLLAPFTSMKRGRPNRRLRWWFTYLAPEAMGLAYLWWRGNHAVQNGGGQISLGLNCLPPRSGSCGRID